jgi:hypothetical protein
MGSGSQAVGQLTGRIEISLTSDCPAGGLSLTSLYQKDGDAMDKLTSGLVLTVVGMGGTILSLWFITLVVQLLKRLFPYREVEEKNGKEVV